MDKDLRKYTDQWEMVCSADLGPTDSALHTFSVLYCQNFKAPPKATQKSLQITHAIRAVWDEVSGQVVEHPSVDSITPQSTEAVQYFLALPWAAKAYSKHASKVHKSGRLATRLRATKLGWLLYPLIMCLDIADLFKHKPAALAQVQAHYEFRHKPTPVSALRYYFASRALPKTITALEQNLTLPPVEKYLKLLRKK